MTDERVRQAGWRVIEGGKRDIPLLGTVTAGWVNAKAAGSFALRLRDARQARGITVAGLALACDMNRSAIVRLERGHRAPTIRTLTRIAQYLGVSTDWLVTGAGADAAGVGPVDAAGPDYWT